MDTTWLNETNEILQELGASIGTQLEDGKYFNMESILSTMIEDLGLVLENRWGDVMDIIKYSCRLDTNRDPPCGYTRSRS